MAKPRSAWWNWPRKCGKPGAQNHPCRPVTCPPHFRLPVSKGGSLPCERTSFIGREQVINQIRQILVPIVQPVEAAYTRVRLLTLTGSGGCGKTRLALRVGSVLASFYPDGIRLVELAPYRGP